MGNYYALSGGTEIPENADLNGYSTPGNYYCNSDWKAATLKNCPIDKAFTLKIEFGNGVRYPTQIITPLVSRRQMSRILTEDWENWVSYVLNSDLASFGIPELLHISDDLHNISHTCLFKYESKVLNNPVPDRGGVGICFFVNSVWVSLFIIPYNRQEIYMCSKISNGWTNWTKK